MMGHNNQSESSICCVCVLRQLQCEGKPESAVGGEERRATIRKGTAGIFASAMPVTGNDEGDEAGDCE